MTGFFFGIVVGAVAALLVVGAIYFGLAKKGYARAGKAIDEA